MRVKVKLAKSVATFAGSFASFTGDMDALGIVWLDELQGGRRVPVGMGIKIQEGSTVQKLAEAPVTAEAKPAKAKAPTA